MLTERIPEREYKALSPDLKPRRIEPFQKTLDKIKIYVIMPSLRIDSRKSGTDKTRSFVLTEALAGYPDALQE